MQGLTIMCYGIIPFLDALKCFGRFEIKPLTSCHELSKPDMSIFSDYVQLLTLTSGVWNRWQITDSHTVNDMALKVVNYQKYKD